MAEASPAAGHERDLIACPRCDEFVSIRASGTGTRGQRRFVCAFCDHRFVESQGATWRRRRR
jgi:transposase-like protein